MATPEAPSAQTPQSPPGAIRDIFDRGLIKKRRARAAKNFEAFNFLLERCEEDFAERLGSFVMAGPAARAPSMRVLCLGAHKGSAARIISAIPDFAPSFVVECDLAAPMLSSEAPGTARLVGSEELLPFAEASFDIILAPLTLHFANDLAGALVQIRRCLKPGGLFLCAVFGGTTLHELREAFATAELEVEGGVSPRIIPFADIKDFGGLLQRVGFRGCVSDVDKVSVSYADVKGLMRDLRGMALTNPLLLRRKTFLRRQTLAMVQSVYEHKYAATSEDPEDRQQELHASFHILSGMGQAPGPG